MSQKQKNAGDTNTLHPFNWGKPTADAVLNLPRLLSRKSDEAALLLNNLQHEDKGGSDSIVMMVYSPEFDKLTENKRLEILNNDKEKGETVQAHFIMRGMISASIKADGQLVVVKLHDGEFTIEGDELLLYHDLVEWLRKRQQSRRRRSVKRVPSETQRDIISPTFPQTTTRDARNNIISELMESGLIKPRDHYDEISRTVQRGVTVELGDLTKQRAVCGHRRKIPRGQLVLGFDKTVTNCTEEALLAGTRELLLAYDTDCAMTLKILFSEGCMHPNGRISYSATKIKQSRGKDSKVTAAERRRYDNHFSILQQATIKITPNDKNIRQRVIPFLVRYGESIDQETGKPVEKHVGINPDLLPAIHAGMGHYFDSGIFRANTQREDWEFRLYDYLSFRWSMASTKNTVNENPQTLRVTLGSALEGAGIDYADRLHAKGAPWLKKRFERVMKALDNWDAGDEYRSMFGSVSIKWDSSDILESMIETAPPLYLLEEMSEKRSKTIAASKRQKAKREKELVGGK
jgi:hypothetical protein